MIEYVRWAVSRIISKYLLKKATKKAQLPLYYLSNIVSGKYENELKEIDKMCNIKKVAIDVGANKGLYTYAMSKEFEKVFSFEPNVEATRYIKNYSSDKINVINVALSSESGKEKLYTPVKEGVEMGGWATMKKRDNSPFEDYKEEEVSVKKLDDFGIKEVSMIKIDAEGSELEVLKGAKKTITNYRPKVLVEVRKNNISDVRDFMDKMDYNEKNCRK